MCVWRQARLHLPSPLFDPSFSPTVVERVVQEQSKDEPNLYPQVSDLTTPLQHHVCLHCLSLPTDSCCARPPMGAGDDSDT